MIDKWLIDMDENWGVPHFLVPSETSSAKGQCHLLLVQHLRRHLQVHEAGGVHRGDLSEVDDHSTATHLGKNVAR